MYKLCKSADLKITVDYAGGNIARPPDLRMRLHADRGLCISVVHEHIEDWNARDCFVFSLGVAQLMPATPEGLIWPSVLIQYIWDMTSSCSGWHCMPAQVKGFHVSGSFCAYEHGRAWADGFLMPCLFHLCLMVLIPARAV